MLKIYKKVILELSGRFWLFNKK